MTHADQPTVSSRLASAVVVFGPVTAISGALLVSACHAEPSETVARGRMGRLTVAVPSDLLLGVMMYEGEDIWDPSSRVEHRPDSQIASFDVALDRTTWRLVHMKPESRFEVRRDRGRYITVEGDRHRVPIDDRGIETRHHDFVVDTMHRQLADETVDGNGLRVVTVPPPTDRSDIQGFSSNYFSARPAVNITCNRSIQVVAPFADISTCLEDFALAGVPTGVRAYINKTDLPNWRKIHDSLEQQLGPMFARQKRPLSVM